MSTASIMVLMSCLVVMGSFGMLVYNINFNLDRLGVLNQIFAFVDTGIVYSDTIETEDGENAVMTADSLPDLDVSDPIAAEVLDLEAAVNDLDNFIYLEDAKKSLNSIAERMNEAEASVLEIGDVQTRANTQLYFNYVRSNFETVSARVNALVSIESRISALDNVSSVLLTSKASGLLEMREMYADYPTVFDNFRRNNLPDRFTITYSDNSKVTTLQYNLEHLDSMVYKVTCHSDVAQTMENIKHGVVLIFSWFMIILFIVSVFVIINTVKLAVYARRQEITIMRYVGATNWFIVLPFILEGIIIGVLSAGLAYGVQYYIYNYIQNMIVGDYSELITVVAFGSLKRYILMGFGGIGILTGIFGSSVSLHKYLKA